MEKSKLGISISVFAAFMYLGIYAGGYVVAILSVGYVLLKEENEWLKKTGVRALAITVLFSLLFAVIGLIPDVISCISNVSSIFGGMLHCAKVRMFAVVLQDISRIAETVVFLYLGIQALNGKDVEVPVIDKIINKYI